MLKHRFVSLVLFALLAGCANNPELQRLGSQLLSQTGLISGSQADSLMKAGGEFAEASRPLSDEQEYYLGRGVAAMILSRYQPLRNDNLNGYVNRVGAVVSAFSDRPETFGGYHFLVLDTDEVNALSTPGGFVFVTKGLVRMAKDEDGLAAILAHEVAHVVKDHGIDAISQSHLTKGLGLLGREAIASRAGDITTELESVFGDSINDVFNTLVEKGYSRSQEYEADSYAAELLARSGYNPAALLDVLEQLKSSESHAGWMSTHPAAQKRINEVKSEAKPSPQAQKSQALRAQRFKSNVNVGRSAKT